MYTIGDFSRLGQIPVKTLRYYDGIGLLRASRVLSRTGYRYYSGAQLAELNRILALKDLGFSLREIRMLVAESVPLDQIRALLRQKVEELEQSVVRQRARLARAAARLDGIERSGHAAAHDVVVRGVRPRFIASVRGMLSSHEECARLFDELDRETGGHSRRQERGAIWHACTEGVVDCEAFVVLPSRSAGADRVRVRHLPAQRVASLVYRGDREYLPAYRAMRSWLAVCGEEIVGPKRELYLESGGPDTESVTEIQFPIGGSL
jgi:DNA-binding transcriptional MerR regulator